MKTAIVILCDPYADRDDALGRILNALAMAVDFKARGMDVAILFQGAGTRWLKEFGSTTHPAYSLYQNVKDKVIGASESCAAFFRTTAAIEKAGVDLLNENPVSGTLGFPSLARLISEGYTIITF